MQKTMRITILVALVTVTLTASELFAQELKQKIGFVDFDSVVKRYYKTQLYQQKIQNEATEEEQNLKDKVEEINKIKMEMELLSDDARSEKEKQLQTKIAEAQGQRERSKRDFQRKTINTMNEIFEEIYDEIEKQGKASGYTYIFRKRVASPAVDQPIILYADEQYDLTENIISALNKGHESDLISEDDMMKPSFEDELKKEMPKGVQ
ncbi:MAG: OmpH family outer membrane protein [Candidatus Auribacterota bacterium]|jgi:Skp family chaperone for outer membrane proteins|nr:OmpH family outer membrane protein [Candidatus Auribacterota bacterium]